MKIILGSSSKWRRQIFAEMGYDFEVATADIDEKAIRLTDPRKLTLAIAEAKNVALRSRLSEPCILITADQVVVCNGQILEKPVDGDEARKFLHLYASYPAETYSAIVVTNTDNGKTTEDVDVAKIYFKPLPEEVIDQMIEVGDIMQASGAFFHDDPLLQPYIAKYKGTLDSIGGLPKDLTKKLIEEVTSQ